MRSALLCVLFTLIIHKGSRVRGDDFRPTPIPLDEWHPTNQDNQAGTLHEIIGTDSPVSVAAVPAHYWEDALRHSVYLTLVRDKIDQLIAKGDVISPNSKINQPVSKEIDDHDLWEKIKKAPFDRIQSEEPNSSGDVTIMAKGRLLESKEGFRFTEDDRSEEKCGNEKCADGVKAFWSVKRVRQRDQEISPGKYHYELTFSVISQIPKKQRKPYENPIRTFTVRETTPDRITDYPQEYKRTEPVHYTTSRPQRAIWFHKNIVPIPPHTRRQYSSGLDRIFSSIFSDDDASSYDQPQPKYRNNPTPPQIYQYSKIGHAGPAIDYHQQPRGNSKPYPYRNQPYKYARPPLQAPPAGPLNHHYLDYDSSPIVNGSPYPSQDTRVSPSQPVKSTRPAVLPTPVPIAPGPKDQTFDLESPMYIDSSDIKENVTRYSEMNNSHRPMYKPKPTPPKVNYFPDHIRPPVYNAPPGVFVTMDKKPFKPMPPLKHVYNSKPQKTIKPIDFRPSPQVHDPQSPNPDPLFDTAFRPITVNYADSSTTERIEHNVNVKKGQNKNRKNNVNSKKPNKKHQHENIKSHRITTATPDIITAQNLEEEIDTLDWANVLGAFTKTTPMVLQTEKSNDQETTTSFTTTGSAVTSPTSKGTTTTTMEATSKSTSTTTITTPKPPKRTRPPPKFTKQDKIKKHKRIIPTSSTTFAPEKSTVRRSTTESTPVISSTIKNIKKAFSWEVKNKTLSTSTTTTTTTTTARPTTTTKPVSTTATSTTTTTTTNAPKEPSTTGKPEFETSSPKRNRFRQSTLIYKGTSVKHDRWAFKNYSTNTQQAQNFRRTSNFQGYSHSTTPTTTHRTTEMTKSSTVSTDSPITESILQSQVADSLESNSVLPLDNENNENSQEESRDHSEYIFEHSSAANYNNNEVIGLELTTIDSVSQQNEIPKNKTKCQKKKQNISTTEVPAENFSEQITTPLTATEASATEDIFEQLFGFNFNSGTSSKDKEILEGQSSNHANFVKPVVDDDDDDLTDFMDELNKKGQHLNDHSKDDEYEDDDDDDDDEDDDDDDDDSSNEDDDDNDDSKPKKDHNSESSRDSRYESFNLDRPYSFLELMAME
ncbi:flocculation protein FLO11-like [Colias croceus]|uniref:flocculation protein FLO11-like n=1 Tax=Colias crocea TaxID=72248 RepID=UPI001E280565|nr:flocculation protein FLO11-like [Colias croceus]